MKYNSFMQKDGVTTIEIVIWIALFALISGIALYSLNPLSQMIKARNSQRQLHLSALLNSVRQNIADTSGGGFTCSSGPLPTSTQKMASTGGYNIAPCLIPIYLTTMPFDPSATSAYYNSVSNYNTGYTIVRNATTGAITLSAPYAEGNQTISIIR